MTDNPLLDVSPEIPFDAISAAQIRPAVKALLRGAREKLAEIAAIAAIANREASYASTLGALDMATDELDFALGVAGHLESVVTTPELREAYNAVQPEVSELYSGILLSEELFRAVKQFAATDEAKRLANAERRYLDKTLADFRRNGAELDASGKKALSFIDVALTNLTLRYAQNVLDATGAFELVVQDEADLAGLPRGIVEQAREGAANKGIPGFRLTLSAPCYGPVMTFAHDRSIRERMYRAQTSRATAPPWDNRPILREVLALRHEKARMLGFAHFADLALDDRMAKRGAVARAFVDELREKIHAAFVRENEALRAFQRESEGQNAPHIEPWDVAYLAEKQRRALYDFDEETLRPYFPLDRVTRGLFSIASRLYGIQITRAAEARVWHPEVTAWHVSSETGERIGSFYLDLFPRDTKRDGAWMGGLLDAAPSAAARRENVAVIVANVTPPRGDRPALLNHREVETLFHEFGHMLHHCLSRVSVRSLSGTRVAADFVELPSKIMENWCWEPEALAIFAGHHLTGEPIPKDVLDRMKRARTYRAANATMRQLGFATVDLALHMDFDPTKDGDVMDYARRVHERFSPVGLPADYAMIASFSHLFGGSYAYAAGYYSYEWAERLDADAFTRFKKEGVLSRDVGESFRSEVLARGDSEDPGVLYRRFLGREPDMRAMLERLGM